ncbi:MAG: phage tail sheath C-terminal domain-containing protein [Anaerolineaceae bacterium]
MVFSVSPSVNVREVDLTAVIPAIGNSPGAIAGVFRWGPVNERVLINSEQALANRFGEPTSFNAETFFTAADYLAYSNALYVVRVASEHAYNAGTGYEQILSEEEAQAFDSEEFIAKYPGEIGNELEISYAASNAAMESVFSDFTVTVGSNTGITTSDIIQVGDTIRVGSPSTGFQNLSVSSITSDTDANTAITTYELGFTRRFFLGEDIVAGTATRLWKYAQYFQPLQDASSVHVVVARNGEILDLFENLSTNPNSKLDDGTSNYYRSVINQRSNWIYAAGGSILATGSPVYKSFSDGTDGYGESTPEIAGAVMQGYDHFANAEEVDISFILQGKANINSNLPNYIISNILDKRMDAVLFISPRLEDVVTPSNPQAKMNGVLDFRATIQNSSYWFMDSGYKYRYDKYNDVYRWVPLNGDIAGLASRIEPWESPAGYRRGMIRNVVKLAFNPTKEIRDQLYGKDINPVFHQVGQGALLFGDKTGLGLASAFNRINVRRLFIVMEKAIATTSRQFLFDFNDEFTQAQFKNMVEPFLRDIQGRRGIIDFRVVSDGTVNTPDVIDRNEFRANIFVKPARTISYISLVFIATRTNTDFEELVGQQF